MRRINSADFRIATRGTSREIIDPRRPVFLEAQGAV
jgi:hypothetical protein